MIPAFTIGMLGGCANGRSMARYFEEVASHYLRTFPRVRYLFSITTEQDRSVVRHLLECRPTLPGLEVAVILSSHQWDSHRCAATDERTAACNRIIDAADFCEVLPESKATLPGLHCTVGSSNAATASFSTNTLRGGPLRDCSMHRSCSRECRFRCNTDLRCLNMPRSIIRPTVGITSFAKEIISILRQNTCRASPTSNEPDSACRRTVCRRFSCASGLRRLRRRAAVI